MPRSWYLGIFGYLDPLGEGASTICVGRLFPKLYPKSREYIQSLITIPTLGHRSWKQQPEIFGYLEILLSGVGATGRSL